MAPTMPAAKPWTCFVALTKAPAPLRPWPFFDGSGSVESTGVGSPGPAIPSGAGSPGMAGSLDSSVAAGIHGSHVIVPCRRNS